MSYCRNVGQDVLPRSSGHLAALPESHERLRVRTSDAGASGFSGRPRACARGGVITPQLFRCYEDRGQRAKSTNESRNYRERAKILQKSDENRPQD